MDDVDRCSLKTAQKKQENLTKGDFVYSCIKFSSLKDFPKQIRIKRKYLTSQDEVPIPCRIGAEDSVRCAEADRDIVRYVDEADKADDGICSAADVRSGQLSQVNKGIRRMPRRFETKKDAISCDKLRRAASKL